MELAPHGLLRRQALGSRVVDLKFSSGSRAASMQLIAGSQGVMWHFSGREADAKV